MSTQFPLSIRDVSPHANAVRLTGKTVTGLPSGFHTGGAWLWEKEVWKPLDGRPWANCDHHVPTNEDEILQELTSQGAPLFPKNWYIEERNGRRFVVRPNSLIFPDDVHPDDLLAWHFDHGVSPLDYIESAIRYVNRRGWYIGEDISLAIDPDANWFLYDLSNARRTNGQLDDECAWDRFVDFVHPARGELKRRAREVQDDVMLRSEPVFFASHIYGSFSRPLGNWASFGEYGKDYLFAHENSPSWSKGVPHTWLLISGGKPLAAEVVKKFELQLCYASWKHPLF